MELWFTMENYGTVEKLWHYGQNYGTIPRTIEFQFTKEKHMVDYQKLWFIVEKNYGNIPK